MQNEVYMLYLNTENQQVSNAQALISATVC